MWVSQGSRSLLSACCGLLVPLATSGCCLQHEQLITGHKRHQLCWFGLLPLYCISSLHGRLRSERMSMRSCLNAGCMTLYCRLQSERMSVGRKKQQIAALDQAVHQARHDYNQKFMALAKLKEECIAQEPQPQKVGPQPQCWLAESGKEIVFGAIALALCLPAAPSKSDK